MGALDVSDVWVGQDRLDAPDLAEYVRQQHRHEALANRMGMFGLRVAACCGVDKGVGGRVWGRRL